MIYDQCKTCRRLGQKLFLKGDRCLSQKCAMVRRAYAPGPQKKRRGGSPSEYKKSLYEKQTLKKWYGLSERQFKKYVKETLAKMGKVENVSNELIKKLESRLDNVIFRLGFVNSRIHARQLVSHGYFLVNGKPVNIPSFNVKKGDIISIKESKKKKPIFKELQTQLKRKEAPLWLNLDRGKFEGKSVGEPNLEEVKPPAEIPLIFEFYSR
ncbi:MAG: 30S ribosomal protein S4 [Candidatus Staskawiczbacteria bacterium RIFCSPLOWO2_12_FULL_37_15]|uniref:Small ribosomal subunit protein uS4 n=1 Tax=Candidatus Staskawiczbacteria bacterium RIFCSPLOWO2_12_FULL_37_15 TaxID=1802218 RepID=A0A1G2IR86_9BACT|nr:MAG: 30S ribosomal protein S4 [Parcubacteria group bacterium GW2011_GWA2_37_10]OGZ77434.1 MAG: 30S ribosomal protein S4 [Candidatus Staskawiczbacteria bacterium RIFCSPLOWO2_12_FULL_37_15]